MTGKRFKGWFAALGLLVASGVGAGRTVGAPAAGRPLNMEILSVVDGLGSNYVYAITQDRVGYMWFGTENGLDRYDGKTIRHYQHYPEDARSLSDSRINCLLSCDDGTLLAGTEKGINVYVPGEDVVMPYGASAEINGENIRTMCEEGPLLWVGTNAGLFRLDRETGSVTCYNTQNSDIAHDIVRAIYIDDDYLFVGTFDGVSRLNKRTGRWSSVNLKMDRIRLPLNNLVLSLEPSPTSPDTLLVGTQTGFCELDKHTLDFRLYEKSRYRQMVNNTIKTMCVVDGQVWLGSEEGLMIFDGASFASYGYDPKNIHSLPNNIVWSIFKDRSNIVWLGTDGGIAYYDAGAPAFTSYDLSEAEGNPYVGISVFAAQADRTGRLWLGSRFGLACYDPASDRMAWIPLSNAVIGTYNFVKGLALDDNDILWVGTAEGLLCYDTRRGCEVPIQSRLSNRLKYIYAVKQDAAGRIYVSDATGRVQIIEYSFDGATRQFVTAADRLVHIGEQIETMAVDDRYVWLGTPGSGLLRYDKTTGSRKRYLSKGDDPLTLGSDVITCLFVDPGTQQLWVGTDKGLARYDAAADAFRRLDCGTGSEAIYTIHSDRSGLLWYTTQHSVTCYDVLSQRAKMFSLSHWFDRRNAIFPVSVAQGSDVLVFGLDCFLRLNWADVNAKKDRAPLYITDIRIDNRTLAEHGFTDRPVQELRRLELPYNRSILSICFAMLDYSMPSLTRYTYQLEGYDEHPKTISGSHPYVEYTKLAPGRYTLHVEAESGDGMAASNTLDFEIVIRPPWWASWWAWVGYALLLAVAAYYLNSITRRRRLVEKELEKEKVEREKIESVNQLKLRFFTNISHDFRTPLSLILSPVETLLDAETDPEKISNLQLIKQNAQRLLRLVNQILDFRKVENQKMKLNASSGDLVATLRGICNSFRELAQKKKISLSFESSEERLVMDFDADKVDKIFFNLLSNALKFTPEEGQVLVSLRRKEAGEVEIMVADTGIGIPDNDLPHIFERFYQVEDHSELRARGTGIGLMIVKEFVDLHHGRIEALSRERQGTTFLVTLPIVNEPEAREPDEEPAAHRAADTASDGNAVAEETVAADAAPGTEFTVLLVEDNEDMRSYLKSELERHYRVIAVEDAESGLKIVNEVMPDLVISDVMLTGMSGVELCRRIKDDFVTNHISVILLTARTAEEHIIEGFNAGADEYIGKPFNLKVLQSRIENILTQRRRLRENLRRDTVDIASIERQSPDELFIRKVVALIEENIADPDLDIPFLCDRLAVSHVNFYRKVKAITGQNVNAFIREIRLKKAAQLLRVKGISVTDAMYEVGFNHRSYFSMCFRELFGVTPKTYAKQHNNDHSADHAAGHAGVHASAAAGDRGADREDDAPNDRGSGGSGA